MKNRKLFLVLGIVLASLGGLLTYSTISSYTQTKQVLVLKKDADPNQPITPEMLETRELPAAAVPNDAITDPQAVVGKSVKGLTLAGSVVRLGMLVNTADSRLSGQLWAKGGNLQAVAFPIQIETTVGGTVEPGDRVDVYTLEKSKVAKKILTDVEVLKGTPKEQKNASSGQNPRNASVVLAIPKDKVQALMDALAREAKIVVVLSPFSAEGQNVAVK